MTRTVHPARRMRRVTGAATALSLVGIVAGFQLNAAAEDASLKAGALEPMSEMAPMDGTATEVMVDESPPAAQPISTRASSNARAAKARHKAKKARAAAKKHHKKQARKRRTYRPLRQAQGTVRRAQGARQRATHRITRRVWAAPRAAQRPPRRYRVRVRQAPPVHARSKGSGR